MSAMTEDRSVDDQAQARAVGLPVDARTLARGPAVIRILLGLTFLSNGLAKLFDFHRVAFGPVVGNLINREDARFILDVEVADPVHVDTADVYCDPRGPSGQRTGRSVAAVVHRISDPSRPSRHAHGQAIPTRCGH